MLSINLTLSTLIELDFKLIMVKVRRFVPVGNDEMIPDPTAKTMKPVKLTFKMLL